MNRGLSGDLRKIMSNRITLIEVCSDNWAINSGFGKWPGAFPAF